MIHKRGATAVVSAVVTAALWLGGCTSSAVNGDARRSPAPTAPTDVVDTSGPGTGADAGLQNTFACGSGMTCGTMAVPLDRADQAGPTLQLQVAVESEESAPKGLLLALAGGPGQAAVPLATTFAERFGEKVLDAYRLVVLDQRGTGNTALRCPAMQAAMGFSDLTPPPAASVTACAAKLGPSREFYSTEDVIADLDQLRQTLGAQRMTVMGTSYGTYVAEHYAIAHPDRVRALVLDSVVPHAGIDPLAIDVMQASRRVLRAACKALDCAGDPVSDLAAVVARYRNGVDLLDVITGMSIVDPTFSSLFPALRAARDGNPDELNGLIDGYHQGFKGPADELSQGLHASALCADIPYPWGDSSASLDGRAAAVDKRADAHSAQDYAPFDRATAVGNGFLRQCLPWPPVQSAGLPTGGKLPPVRTLLVAGGRDLSTPLEWARAEAAKAPRGELVVVSTSGHSVYGRGGQGKQAVDDFLL